MAEFVEVMKQRRRMHKHFMKNDACSKCPISSVVNGKKELCFDFVCRHFEEAERIIMGWAAEHPIITNADKAREALGLSKDEFKSSGCMNISCPDDRETCEGCPRYNFWSQEWKEPKEKE